MISIRRMRGRRTYSKGINSVVIGFVSALLVLSTLVIDQSIIFETSGTSLSEKCDVYKSFNNANETPTALLGSRQAGQEDWVVTSPQVVENEVRTQTSNITIMPGGSLTLYNTTLLVNSSADVAFVMPYYIDVQPGGKFYAYDRSKITANTIPASSSAWTFVDSLPLLGPKARGSIEIEIKVYDGTATETWNVRCVEPSVFIEGKTAKFEVIGSVSGLIGTFTSSIENWGWSEWFDAPAGQLSVRVRNPQFNAEECYDYTVDDLFKFDTTSATTRPFMFYVRAGAIFEMRNSELHHCGWNNLNKGLTIETNYALIDNCKISGNYFGIVFEQASNNVVKNCNISSNAYCGIYIKRSFTDNTIQNCTISNNTYGIYSTESHNDTILNCTILNNSYGIYFNGTQNDTLRNNALLNNTYNFKARRLGLWDFYHDIDASNTINGKKMYYLIKKNNLVLDGAVSTDIGYLGLVSCNNITVKNLNIADSGEGLLLANATNVTVTNSNFSNNDYGVAFHCDHSNNFVENCKIFSNNFGVLFSKSSNNFVKNCEISNNFDGIFISESSNNFVENCEIFSNNFNGINITGTSSYNTIRDCEIFSNNFNGVNITGSASYNTIRNCHIFSNNFAGVNISTQSNNFVENCKIFSNNFGVLIDKSSNNFIKNCELSNNFDGIFIAQSSNNFVENCKIFSNNFAGVNITSSSSNNFVKNCKILSNNFGVYLAQSSNNFIENNDFLSNNFGVYITLSSDNNTICHNNFISNTNNAYDACSNYWNATTEGNYWSDYTGSDANSDGIGDTAYNIPGGTNKDNYPLMKPWYAPVFLLEPGWNFVTLPSNSSIQNAEALANAIDNCTHVARWNTTTKSLEVHQKGSAENNFTIGGLYGYFVYVLQPSYFNPGGSKTQNLSLGLKQGWNSVGWFNVTDTDAKSLAQNITNCTAISYWNNTLGRFITYVVGTNTSNFAIEKVNAYLVFVASDETWVNG